MRFAARGVAAGGSEAALAPTQGRAACCGRRPGGLPGRRRGAGFPVCALPPHTERPLSLQPREGARGTAPACPFLPRRPHRPPCEVDAGGSDTGVEGSAPHCPRAVPCLGGWFPGRFLLFTVLCATLNESKVAGMMPLRSPQAPPPFKDGRVERAGSLPGLSARDGPAARGRPRALRLPAARPGGRTRQGLPLTRHHPHGADQSPLRNTPPSLWSEAIGKTILFKKGKK